MRQLLGALLLLGWAGSADAVPGKPSPRQTPIVFTQTAEPSPVFDRLTYPARVVPTINATVLAEASGVVNKTYAPLGTQVKKGERVMTIVNTDPVYKFAPAAVRAPVTGVVSRVDVTEGTRVTAGDRLMQITDPREVQIELEVAVSDLGAIRSGMEGKLFLHRSEPTEVKVVGISPYVDPGTGTAQAILAVTDEKARLTPGLVGKVTFRAREHLGVEIPESAVVYKGRDPHVRIIEEGVAKFKPVQLGPTRQGLVEVISGLEKGSQYVVRASTYVGDGEKVIVQGTEDTESKDTGE